MKPSLLWKWILVKIEKYGFKLKKDLPVPETIEELNSVLQQNYHPHTLITDSIPMTHASHEPNLWPRFSYNATTRIGTMTLFGWNGNSKEENRRVIRLIREWISLHEFRGIIIDLREHRGGNMWPYLEGLSPLIGDSTLLAWGRQKESKKNGTKWINMKKSGRIQSGLYTRKDLPFPIAVLVGKQTASSGEFTALALHGRKHVRLFGEPTAGFTSMNRTFTYKKNTSLHLTTDGVTGYNGKFYNGKMKPIIPDVISQDPMKEARSYILG